MSIVNLQRDALFVATEAAPIVWGALDGFSEAGGTTVNADPTVYDDFARVRSSRDTAVILNAAESRTIGLYIRPPGPGLSPYRVKAYADTVDRTVQFHLVMGFAPDTITGTGDVIVAVETVGLAWPWKIDELVMMPQEILATEKALFFGIMMKGACNVPHSTVTLSVQRLATAPPQFDQSVS